jgi:hypothetical protein
MNNNCLNPRACNTHKECSEDICLSNCRMFEYNGLPPGQIIIFFLKEEMKFTASRAKAK